MSKTKSDLVRPGTHLTLVIDRLATGGRGVARLDGRVVFVEGAVAPGETVLATVHADKGRFLEARLSKVLEASPRRVEPKCRHFGTCGGCSWQHLPYEDQLSTKVSLLEDSLRRLGKLETWPTIEVRHGEPWGSRNRAQFQPGAPGQPWGFFEPGSRDTVSLKECPVLSPELQGVWDTLRKHEGDPGAERRQRSAFAWGAQGATHFTMPGERAPSAKVEILGRTFEFPVDGFFQSNLALVPEMVEAALGDLSGNRALDLYCGVGLFASFLQDRFAQVDAVESDFRASRFAPGNLSTAVYHDAFAEAWLERELERGSISNIDAIVVDPPREGLSERAMRAILAVCATRVRYVSCGHDTLARDLRQFVSEGYELERLVMIDLYPQTPHLEVVAWLRHRGFGPRKVLLDLV
jgi:23S rRNA (uracil1939-C5)-methyltransferase